jgi:four helix bundle protein
MASKHNFRKLKIWQEGVELVSLTYKIIKNFPKFEQFILISQLLRCALSVPSNISEGTSKSSDKHLNKYIEDALGSAYEWETQIIVAKNEGYVNESDFNDYMILIQNLQGKIINFQNTLDINN